MKEKNRLSPKEAILYFEKEIPVIFVTHSGFQLVSEISGISLNSSKPFKAKRTNKWHPYVYKISSLIPSKENQEKISFDKCFSEEIKNLYILENLISEKVHYIKENRVEIRIGIFTLKKIREILYRDLLMEISIEEGVHHVRLCKENSKDLLEKEYPRYLLKNGLTDKALKLWERVAKDYI